MDDATNPLGEVEAVDAIASLLDGPDDREPEIEEEEPQEPQADAEEEAPEEAESDAEATDETPEEFEEITWNGETKKVPKSELKDLAQKGFDYTQKTQQLGEAKRQFEAQVKAAQQSFAIQQQQAELIGEVKSLDSQLAQFKEVKWHELAESDPVQYLKLNQTYRDLKEAREAKVQEFHQKTTQAQQYQQAMQAQYVQEQAKLLVEAIPEMKGPKAGEIKARIAEYLKAEGFSPEEIGGVTDHRSVKLAWKAAQWDALQASKPALTKKAAEAPRVVKPGTPKAQVPQAQKDTYAQLRKTGRGEYAAKLIEQML